MVTKKVACAQPYDEGGYRGKRRHYEMIKEGDIRITMGKEGYWETEERGRNKRKGGGSTKY